MAVDLPDGWREVPLGEVLRVATRREMTDPATVYRMLGVRLYGRGAFVREERRGDSLSVPYAHRVEAGDLVFSRLFASKGTFCLIGPEHTDCYTSNEFPAFRLKAKAPADLTYILSQVCRPRFWEKVDAFCTGTTTESRFRLNERDFLRLRVPLPPLAEQRAIGAALHGAAGAVDSANGVIEALVEAKRNLMRRLLTLGTSGGGANLHSLQDRWVMGRIAEDVSAAPAGWRLVQLTQVAKLESGHTPSREHPEWWGGDIPWLSLADTDALDGLTVTETAEQVTPEGISNSSARILPAGTVAFSRTATVGKSTIMGVAMATSQDFANWVCGPALEPRYLLQVFRHMSREWERLQEGSTHQTIYMPVFKRLQILLPPMDEQVRIADVGEAFDRRIEAERALLSERVASRNALAGELLSGRLRLPPAVIARHTWPDPDARAA